MQLYNQYNNEREIQDTEYKKVQENRENFENASKGNNEYIDNMLEEKNSNKQIEENLFRENLSMKINDQMNRANIGDLKGQLDNQLDFATQNKKDINIPTANDLKISQNNNIYENNSLFEEYKKNLFTKRKYINREHFITISSGDRDWFNNSNENRFNFQVKFNPSVTGKTLVPKVVDGKTVRIHKDDDGNYYGDVVYEEKEFLGSTACGLPKEFKNIVSFEMIRSLFAIENIILPFDNRIFIDFKSLPYVVLKIDEIEGLYSGTNSKIDKSFAHLLWDKDNASDVTTGLDYNNKYSRQMKRGYCLMAPLGFEKKTFYPSPLASLNTLSLNLMTPKGQDINNHPDVLKISTVKFITPSYTGSEDESVVADVAYGTGNLTIKTAGVFATSKHELPQRLQFKFTVATSASRTFTVIGKNVKGSTIMEVVTGGAVGVTVKTILKYASITSITPSAASAGGAKVKVGNEGVSNLEIDEANGFPNDDSEKYLEIVTSTFFSNRFFKIGDNIKIKNFKLDSGSVTETNVNLNEFINREEGHYIINLARENTQFNTAKNEGWIQKIYISPPGNIDYTATSIGNVLKSGSESSDYETAQLNDSTTCKIINQSLQSNYGFKIITREDDLSDVMNSSNI